MHNSANALNEDSLSDLKSLIALKSPIMPSCTISSRDVYKRQVGTQAVWAEKTYDEDWQYITGPGGLTITGEFADVTSVSYTHLDVYKRQGLHPLSRTQ